MLIKYYKKIADLPGIEKFSDLLPVFASQEYADYLKAVKNSSVIWFHCSINHDNEIIIPFAVRNKMIFKTGMFLTAPICLVEKVVIETEREFLNSIIAIIKKEKLCDWIGQPPNWAIFNVVPSNSIYCEFGSYIIDLLNNSEEELYAKVNYHHKRLLNKAKNNNIAIKNSIELLEDCSNVFMDAANHGNHTLPKKKEIEDILRYLPDNTDIYVSYNESHPQSSVICFTNKFCVYAAYIGKTSDASVGENHLLHWQAIKDAKQKGIKYFDFIGARINPFPGSKQEGIQKFKKYFGGELVRGYLWKMPIRKLKYHSYNFLVRGKYFIKFNKYKGDIIDQELKRTKQ
jgi:hypothetical protein